MVLSSFKFSSASSRDVEGGLLGWVSFELNGVLGVDGCAVRRTRDGRTMVSFPTRKASDGTRHPILRPLDGETRNRLENAILGALKGELAPAR